MTNVSDLPMTSLSDPTLGLIVDVVPDYEVILDRIGGLLTRCDLARYTDGARCTTKLELLNAQLFGAREAANRGDREAHKGLLKFVKLFLEKTSGRGLSSPWLGELRENLLADGYEIRRMGEHLLPGQDIRYELLPTDAEAVPLADEIGALERELRVCGFTVAVNHYKQAIANFQQHHYEASNGALRTTFEEVVRQVGNRHGVPDGLPVPQTIKRLVGTVSLFAEDAEGPLLQGMWRMLQPNGPHPGKSNADEARFRMQVVTAVLRFLLRCMP